MKQQEFKALLERCIEGEERAQSVLYKRFFESLKPFCIRYTKSEFIADDIIQEGWLNAIKSLPSFKGEVQNFTGWIMRIMSNICKRQLQRELIYDERELNDFIEVSNELYKPASDDLALKELKEKIDALPVNQRYTFILHELAGYNHKEISNSLDITEGTSRSNLHKAKKNLKDQLGDK